jgi:hypothetical protein
MDELLKIIESYVTIFFSLEKNEFDIIEYNYKSKCYFLYEIRSYENNIKRNVEIQFLEGRDHIKLLTEDITSLIKILDSKNILIL